MDRTLSVSHEGHIVSMNCLDDKIVWLTGIQPNKHAWRLPFWEETIVGFMQSYPPAPDWLRCLPCWYEIFAKFNALLAEMDPLAGG